MSTRRANAGLTLVELLIAMTMVVAIISMVIAGYLAVNRSAESCTAKMTLAWRQLCLLDNIAGQIRCAYAPPQNPAQSAATLSQSKTVSQSRPPCCFSSDTINPSGALLHILTTKRFDSAQPNEAGLFMVDYKFDPQKGVLLLSQQSFAAKSGDAPQWRQVAENIKDIRLQFFDGQKWLDNWDYNAQKNLPSAARITIEYLQDDQSTSRYSTTAFLYLAQNYRQTVKTKFALQDIK